MHEIPRAIPIVLLALGGALSFFNTAASIAVTLPSAIALFATDRKARSLSARWERDSLSFLGRLSSSRSVPFSRRLLESSKDCVFRGKISDAVKRYERSGELGFGGLLKKGTCLPEALALSYEAMRNGTDVDKQLSILLEQRTREKELRVKHSGSVANAVSLTRAGSMVFFPAFAGICRNIAGMGTSGWSLYAPFTVVVLAYIGTVVSIQAFFSRGSRLKRAGGAVGAFCIGATVFNAVTSLSGIML